MDSVNPTADSGASIQDRLENFLSADEPQAQDEADAPEVKAQAEPADVESEVDADEGEGEGEEPSISLSDLSKYLGIDEQYLDVDEDGTVSIKTKVDGQESKTKLKDLQTSYQLRQHLDNETRAVAEQQKAMREQAAQVERVIQERVQQVEYLANAAQEQLTREFNNIDWQLLRQADPAEYSALSRDFEVRQAHINGIGQHVANERQQYAVQYQQQSAAQLQEEAKALPSIIPEWSKADVAERERGEIKEWALKNGIPKAEVDSVSRAAHVAIMRKAMLYDRIQSSKASVENKVRTAPKLVKPGQTSPANSNESSARNLKAAIKKSGGKTGIAEYLIATGKV
jgi:hypothetical protein